MAVAKDYRKRRVRVGGEKLLRPTFQKSDSNFKQKKMKNLIDRDKNCRIVTAAAG